MLAVVTPIAAALMHKPTQLSRLESGVMFVVGAVLLLIKRVPVRKAKS